MSIVCTTEGERELTWVDSRTTRRPLKQPHVLRFITDKKGLIHWQVSAHNGKILYKSSEGYAKIQNAVRAYTSIRDAQLSGSVDESALEGKRRAEDTFAVNR